MVVVELHEIHLVSTVGTYQGIISEGRQDGDAPLVKATIDLMFAFVDRSIEFCIDLAVPGIQAAIADHLVMLFRDMTDEPLYEFDSRDGLFNIFVVFMAVVMKSNVVPVIFIDP